MRLAGAGTGSGRRGRELIGDTVSDRNVPYRTGCPHVTRYLPEESVMSFVIRVALRHEQAAARRLSAQARLGAAFRSAGR